MGFISIIVSPMTTAHDYIASEKFIHDGLLLQADHMVRELKKLWEESQGRINSFAITWVSESVSTPEGNITDKVTLELPSDKSTWPGYLRQLVEKSKAYAILFVDTTQGVKAIFESQHGTRRWRMSTVDKGTRKTLSSPVPHDDVEGLGLLWFRGREGA